MFGNRINQLFLPVIFLLKKLSKMILGLDEPRSGLFKSSLTKIIFLPSLCTQLFPVLRVVTKSEKVWLLITTLGWETGINCQTHLNIFGTMDVASSHTLHVWNRPSGCHPKILNYIFLFWHNFKVQLSPLWLLKS